MCMLAVGPHDFVLDYTEALIYSNVTLVDLENLGFGAKRVKTLATKSDSQSSDPCTHKVGGEN